MLEGGKEQEGKRACDVAASLWLRIRKLTFIEHLLCAVSALPRTMKESVLFHFTDGRN